MHKLRKKKVFNLEKWVLLILPLRGMAQAMAEMPLEQAFWWLLSPGSFLELLYRSPGSQVRAELTHFPPGSPVC